MIANLIFSASENKYQLKYMSCFVAKLENFDDPLNNQNNPDGHQKLINTSIVEVWEFLYAFFIFLMQKSDKIPNKCLDDVNIY